MESEDSQVGFSLGKMTALMTTFSSGLERRALDIAAGGKVLSWEGWVGAVTHAGCGGFGASPEM